jgi:hypothetical protein
MTSEVLTMVDASLGALALLQLRAVLVELRALAARVERVERRAGVDVAAVA